MSSKINKLAAALDKSDSTSKLKSTTELVQSDSVAPKKKASRTISKKAPSRANLSAVTSYISPERSRDIGILILDLKAQGIKISKEELGRVGYDLAYEKYKKMLK